jgi:hypothetical protein
MAVLEDIVRVDIAVQSQSPSRATFAVPLIAGFHTRFAERVRSYSSIDALEDDGFVATDAEHKIASAIFAQSPTVPLIKVGRLAGAQNARVVKLLATARNETAYVVEINGTEFSFTSDVDATAAEIATGLTSAINAGSLPVTASVDTNNLMLTADVSGPDFYVDVTDESLWASIQDTTAARSSLATDLSEILAADPDWYALVLTRNNHLDIAAAAAWIETRKRVLFAGAINFGAIVSAQNNLGSNSTSLVGVLAALTYNRTGTVFTKHEADFPHAALLGAVLPLDPGSWTAHCKTLTGVQASLLSDTERINLEANFGNHYQVVAGINVLFNGYMASGRFFDLQVFVDWNEARIKEEIFSAMAFSDNKIPYTQAGIDIIENCISKVLDQGTQQGGWAPGTTFVRSPKFSTISAGNKAARLLDDVVFGGTYAGAIHEVEVAGKLTQ